MGGDKIFRLWTLCRSTPTIPILMALNRILLIVALANFVYAEDDDDDDFADTPLLSSLWEATSQGNNDAIDRLLDSSEQAISARAADGRGLAWWAYEFQNVYALASIIAFGGDIESGAKDTGGETAVAMCERNTDCNKAELIQKAKGMAEDVKKRKEERKKEREEMDAEIDDIDSVDDDEF